MDWLQCNELCLEHTEEGPVSVETGEAWSLPPRMMTPNSTQNVPDGDAPLQNQGCVTHWKITVCPESVYL